MPSVEHRIPLYDWPGAWLPLAPVRQEWPPVALVDVTWDPASGRLSGVVAQGSTARATDPAETIRMNPEPVGRLVQLMQRFGAPISGMVDCEVIQSAPEGAIAIRCDPGRVRLSFVFAAPGEDGKRPSSEFVPYEPDPRKAAFLARMAALYDQRGVPDEYEEDMGEGRTVQRVVFG